MIRPSLRTRAVVVSVVAVAAGGWMPAATAASAHHHGHDRRHAPYLSDPRGDVVKDTGYHCVDPLADITRVEVTRRGRRDVVVSTRYVSMPGRWADTEFVALLTPAFAWEVQINPRFDGRISVVLDTPHGQEYTTAATTRIDRRAREIALTVPWRLIGDPREVRVAVRSLHEDTCTGGFDGNDRAGVRGATSSLVEGDPVYGHRVRRR